MEDGEDKLGHWTGRWEEKRRGKMKKKRRRRRGKEKENKEAVHKGVKDGGEREV